MIKKLRNKFIAIMMSMVAVILIIVFTALVIANEKSSSRNAEMFMQQSLFSAVGPERFPLSPDMKPKDLEKRPMHMFPSVIVKIDNGEISRIDTREMETGDINLDEWIEYARENADSRGYGEIKPGNIRFYVRSFEDKTNIIFADFSFEMEQRRNFVFLCLMGFMMACLAIFILSWFLSGWVVKPVKETWDMQNQFIADASHELKTPLTVIIADSNILMSHGDSKISEQKRWIDSIRDESLAMKKLVEDMLFISKANVEKSYKEIAEFDVSDVVTDKTLEFEAVAYEKQVELHDDIERGLRTTGDRTEFGRLTAVLLDNAIKYSESNGSNKKTVRISLKKSGKKIKLSVSNSCNGLNENTIRHAFDRFYRGDVTRNRDDGSYGLGLSIAAEIVKQMAGKIECRYERGCAVFEAEINSSNKN